MARAAAVALAGAAVAIVIWFQLTPYVDRDRPGVTFDAPYYVWRTTSVGVDGTATLVALPNAASPHPERPGFPVLGAIVGTLTGAESFSFVIEVRAVMAVAIGLAAGAMAVAALGRPGWAFGVFVIMLGTSAAVTGTLAGSLENALADVPLMALAGVVPLVLHRRPGIATVVILLAGAALVHWVFAALFLAVVVAAIAISVIVDRQRAIDRRRALLVVAAMLAALALAAILMPALPGDLPPVKGVRGNILRLGFYSVPWLLALASVAAIAYLRTAVALGRTTAVLLVVWAAILPAALVASEFLPFQLKNFRVAAFALGVPALVALGAVMLPQLRRGVGWSAAGVVVMVAIVVFAMPGGAGPLRPRDAGYLAKRYEEARVAGAYLAGLREATPVVFVIDGYGRIYDRLARAAVPPEMIADMSVYVGDVEDLLAGRPTTDASRPKTSHQSFTWWRDAWPDPDAVLGRDPVLIALARPSRGEAIAELAPGVHVLRGPSPREGTPPPSSLRLSWGRAVSATMATLLILAIVGLGWARTLLDTGISTALGLAPAFGVAILVIGGTIVARAGIGLDGPAAIALVAVGATVGWLPAVVQRWRRDAT